MKSDIEIAQSVPLKPITEIASQIGIPDSALEFYGKNKAKIGLDFLSGLSARENGKLVLVTAMSPTPAGEGKTTTTVGLGDALNRLGEKAIVCLREPSLGPVFGMKGGATGGGYAQAVPMEDINLHFTGDFNAVALAHNLLAALIDNHIHHGNSLRLDVRKILWRRVMDMNDRALRQIVVGLGGAANGFPRESGFDIVVASEVMAVLCLARSLEDLKTRLGEMVIGVSLDKTYLRARDLGAHRPMAVLLKEAIKPNLVQSLEGTPLFIHGGPFANIAHGCNSIIATQSALKLGQYVVTEAGFGADLGAEKFLGIKCRSSGLWPAATVLVATIRALKYHGGADVKSLSHENLGALRAGLVNLRRHYENLTKAFGVGCVIALNHFSSDTEKETELLQADAKSWGALVEVCTHWGEGGVGAEGLAKQVVRIAERKAEPKFLYSLDASLIDKLKAVATTMYRATGVSLSREASDAVAFMEKQGFGQLPICVAKTPYSFSSDPKALGATENHILEVQEAKLSAGAGFVVFLCGGIHTMPGLPRDPAANRIDIDPNGRISGLF
jgi:formate--tetrahydrofolate ligase